MRTIFLLFMVLLSTMTFAQDDETELPETDDNFEKYLDDGIHHDAGNYPSISFSEIIGGYINLHYERRITNMFSVDASIAKPIWLGIDPIELIFNDYYYAKLAEQPDNPSGIGYGFSLRRNPSRRAIANFGYHSLNFRHRTMKFENISIKRSDYYYATGWKQLYNNNIGLEIMQCIGLRKTSYELKDVVSAIDAKPSNIFYYIDFKIGYFF